jgi:hypothetical protein
MPMPVPPKLTEGLPDVQTIARQKAGYASALDKQLKEAMETVTKETMIEKEMVSFAAKKNVALYEMQVDERLAEQLAAVDEQCTFAQLELKKALVERNLQLNNQASQLVMDYRSKTLQDECRKKHAAFNEQYLTAERNLQQQLGGAVGTTYSAPPYAVPLASPAPAPRGVPLASPAPYMQLAPQLAPQFAPPLAPQLAPLSYAAPTAVI